MGITLKIIKKIFLTSSFVLTSFFALTSYGQTQIGRQLATCRGKFIVFAMTNYELNQVETANYMKEQQQEVDRLSPKYISRADYDQISANEIKRFSPLVRQNAGGGFTQAISEMLKCVEFIRDLKK